MTAEATADRFRQAVEAGDTAGLRALAAESPELVGLLDKPWFGFASPALVHAAGACDRALADTLLDLGADIDARSEWEAGGYSALHRCVDGPTPEKLELGRHLVERGATIDLHSAAGLGRLDLLSEYLDAEPERVSEPGPDGATPLHLAASVEVARFLLDRGADLEKRCVDHTSTPLMWSVQGPVEVTRFLLEAGARPDLFVAAVLNDVELARRILEEDPDAITVSVRYGHSHPHLGGGDKYFWALDFADSPLEVARRRGHDEVYAFLLERSPAEARLLQACRRDDSDAAAAVLEGEPALLERLSGYQAREALIGGAGTSALLIDRGMDPNIVDDEGATALHHAAWRGNVPLIRALLERGADPTIRESQYGSTPLGWAIHNGQHRAVRVLEDMEQASRS